MPIFHTLLKITKKHLVSALIYFAIFFILCMMLSDSGDQINSYSTASLTLVVYDRDNSEASKNLIAYLETIHDVRTDMEDDSELIQDSLYYRKIDYVLYIEPGYGNTGELKNIKRQGTNVGVYVDGQIAQYERSMNALLAAGYSMDEAYALAMEALDSEGLVVMQERKEGKGNLYYFYDYLSYVLTMILCMTLAPIIMAFHKKELSDRLNISPVTARSKHLQVMTGSVLISVVVWLIFVILALVFYGKDSVGNAGRLCIWNAFVYMIVAAGLASMIGSFQMSHDTLNMVSNIVGLGMAFLSGIFVPIEFFGKGMLTVAKFMPGYWYLMAQEEIFARGATSEMFAYMGMELLFAAAFFAVGMMVSKQLRVRREA